MSTNAYGVAAHSGFGGHAVLCARPVVGGQSFVVALGDSVIGMHAQSEVVRTMMDGEIVYRGGLHPYEEKFRELAEIFWPGEAVELGARLDGVPGVAAVPSEWLQNTLNSFGESSMR